jgi:hypothetical protein
MSKLLLSWISGRGGEPIEQRGAVPAQEVEPAAEAIAGDGEDRLERGDRAGEQPRGRAGAHGEQHERDGQHDRAERLGEPRRELAFELPRWRDSQCLPDIRPGATEDRVAGAERGADPQRQGDREDEDRRAEHEGDDEDRGGQAAAEAVAARINLSG